MTLHVVERYPTKVEERIEKMRGLYGMVEREMRLRGCDLLAIDVLVELGQLHADSHKRIAEIEDIAETLIKDLS